MNGIVENRNKVLAAVVSVMDQIKKMNAPTRPRAPTIPDSPIF